MYRYMIYQATQCDFLLHQVSDVTVKLVGKSPRIGKINSCADMLKKCPQWNVKLLKLYTKLSQIQIQLKIQGTQKTPKQPSGSKHALHCGLPVVSQ